MEDEGKVLLTVWDRCTVPPSATAPPRPLRRSASSPRRPWYVDFPWTQPGPRFDTRTNPACASARYFATLRYATTIYLTTRLDEVLRTRTNCKPTTRIPDALFSSLYRIASPGSEPPASRESCCTNMICTGYLRCPPGPSAEQEGVGVRHQGSSLQTPCPHLQTQKRRGERR